MPVFLPGPTLTPGIANLLGSGSYNGLNWGPSTDFHIGANLPTGSVTAATWAATGLTGLNDLPALRTSDISRASDHGDWRGLDYVGPRTIHMEILIIPSDGTAATLYGDLALVEKAFQPQTSVELPLLLFNSTRLVNCRVRKRSAPYETGYQPTRGAVLIELVASDPRIYDATLQTFTLGLPSSTGGAAWPFVWPVSWGTASAAGTVQATNAGNTPTRPTVIITGPVDNPTIENVTAGRHLTFAFTLASTDTLTLDLDAHSALLNGNVSRRSTMTSDSTWWELAPGNSQINYRANTNLVGSTATVSFRSAFL